MRKRKGRTVVDNTETLKSTTKNFNPVDEEEEGVGHEKEDKGVKGFFACYLLTSLCPRYKGHTYIGFTVNPRRRIRQHNGEIKCGAWRTKKRRPWEMVLCIYGFPTNVSALQFEWAWQHPTESLAVRQAAATFKSFSGVANKIKLAYTMLNLPNWQSLSIKVNYFSTKYSKLSASCPSLPEHMKVQVCTMDELPCYTGGDEHLFGDENGWGDENCVEDSDKSGSLEETFADASINISTDYSHGIDEASCEQFVWSEQYGKEQPRESSSLEVDCRQPFGLINSVPGTACSVVASVSEGETAEDADVFGFVQESNNKLGWQRSEEFAPAVNADENQLPLLREKQFTIAEVPNKDQQTTHNSTVFQDVEVIDLLTPSPHCRIMSCAKKRNICSVSPVIIDLT